MKQILQNPRSGKLEQVEVPAPAPDRGQILVRNAYSVMSPGTEKLAMDFARSSLVGKARSRPDLVAQVIRKLGQEGPLPTYRAVVNRLDAPQPLGYASAGVVEQVGAGVDQFRPGDRVACAGAGYANHAELVVVPTNLTVCVPESLGLDRASFATLGSIALQGIRVGDPRLGEIVLVVGLGLIGQLTVQLLLANGCRVLGLDLDPSRVERALGLGMEWGGPPTANLDSVLARATDGHGVDLAIVTASADSSEPIAKAAEACRHRGRVVVVGATAMSLDRRTFYEKELELRMSMSYGPGRYDRRYEEEGYDYPLPYVRWTEQRNLRAFVELASRGNIDPLTLDVEVVDFAAATDAYEALGRGERRSLAVVFRYSEEIDRRRSHALVPQTKNSQRAVNDVGVAFIGAGNYAKGVLLPLVAGANRVALRSIVAATGASARRTAERFGFANCGTDPDQALGDESVHLVFVATRHDSHSDLAVRAMRAGKSVWLEKPVGLTLEEVEAVASTARELGAHFTVGFNRRFSAHARAVKAEFADRTGPMAVQYVIAAGPAPAGSWLMDPSVGGGRLIGEACHFVDLCNFLVGRSLVQVSGVALAANREIDDSTQIVLSYSDGSIASIAYLANASTDLVKERWEAHAEGRSMLCDNFRALTRSGSRKRSGINQDKGQATAVREFIKGVRTGSGGLVPLEEIVSASAATIKIADSIRENRPMKIDWS